MKTKFKTLFCVLSLVALFSCSEGQQQEEPSVPLELSRCWSFSSPWSDNLDSLEVISGNGDYELIYPNYVSLHEPFLTGEPVPEEVKVLYPEYLDSMISLFINESGYIVINGKSVTDGNLFGMFMLKDAKDQRKVFEVFYWPDTLRPIIGMDAFEDRNPIDPGEDYWVNY
jgi:hypothetical protein